MLVEKQCYFDRKLPRKKSVDLLAAPKSIALALIPKVKVAGCNIHNLSRN